MSKQYLLSVSVVGTHVQVVLTFSHCSRHTCPGGTYFQSVQQAHMSKWYLLLVSVVGIHVQVVLTFSQCSTHTCPNGAYFLSVQQAHMSKWCLRLVSVVGTHVQVVLTFSQCSRHTCPSGAYFQSVQQAHTSKWCLLLVSVVGTHVQVVLTFSQCSRHTCPRLVSHETAAISAQVLCTPYNHAPCHFMQSHIRKLYAGLAVTCHLHFWQNDQDLLRATAVTRGWNGYRNKSQQNLHCSCRDSNTQPFSLCGEGNNS